MGCLNELERDPESCQIRENVESRRKDSTWRYVNRNSARGLRKKVLTGKKMSTTRSKNKVHDSTHNRVKIMGHGREGIVEVSV